MPLSLNRQVLCMITLLQFGPLASAFVLYQIQQFQIRMTKGA
jgi:hypothetical protein